MKKLNFTPFPILRTERLVLRSLDLSDDQQIFLLRTNKRVNKYIVRPKQKNIKEIRAFISKIINGIINNEWIYWAISEKESNKLIGTICLWNFSSDNVAEVGYELFPAFHGKGIMSEALEKIIEYGFKEIELNSMEAYTHKKNHSSTKLLQKYNFVQDAERIDKENSDNIIFKLTQQNWKELNTYKSSV